MVHHPLRRPLQRTLRLKAVPLPAVPWFALRRGEAVEQCLDGQASSAAGQRTGVEVCDAFHRGSPPACDAAATSADRAGPVPVESAEAVGPGTRCLAAIPAGRGPAGRVGRVSKASASRSTPRCRRTLAPTLCLGSRGSTPQHDRWAAKACA